MRAEKGGGRREKGERKRARQRRGGRDKNQTPSDLMCPAVGMCM